MLGICYLITGNNWNKMNNLEYLELYLCHHFEDDFFQKNDSFNNLYTLSIIGCNRLKGDSWSEMNNLKHLKLHHCPQFEDDFFQKSGSFNNLYTLSTIGCQFLE